MEYDGRVCPECQEYKPLDVFPFGHKPCKACYAAKARARRQADPSKARAAGKKWRAKNPEKARASYKTWRRNNLGRVYESQKAWRLNNPEKIRAHARTKYVKDRANILAKNKAYRDKNAAKVSVMRKALRLANLEQERARQRNPKYRAKARARMQAWRKNNPDRILAQTQKRRALKYDVAINDFTAYQWREMLEAYGHRCVYCDRKMQRLTQDHITPLVAGGNHTKSNIVPACRSCNSKKGKGAPLVPVQPLLL